MNVVSINSHPRRFAPGSRAIHRFHGWCEVVAARGERRLIRWVEHVPQRVVDVPDQVETLMGVDFIDVLEQEVIVTHEGEVSADELRAA